MIRATFPYCTHGDDMMFVFFIASMDGLYKSGGLGGAQPPPFANTRIRATFPNSEHGDDMMLVFYCTHGLVTVIFIMIIILTIISTSNSNGNKK